MIGSFNFNGVESSDFKLVCKSVKRPLLPAAKVNRTEIPSLSGVYDFDGHEYSLRSISMRIAYIGTNYEELRSRARQIAAWLSTKSWVKLIINDESDKYYLAKVTNEIDLDSLWESGTADVEFDCQPFAYSVTENAFTFNTNAAIDYNFNNLGTREINFKSPPGSKSLIRITGSWTNLTLSMNGKTLSYTNIGDDSELVIDNVKMEVTQDDINTFNYLDGDIDSFLEVISGANSLNVDGEAFNISVVIEFISMWM